MKSEGVWPCLVLGAVAGEDDKRNLVVRINVKITDGPDAGQFGSYEEKVDMRTGPYVRRSCTAVGWAGGDILTLKGDCDRWIKDTGGASTVEVVHLEIKNGKRAGQIWDKIKSIGRGPKPLSAPSRDTLADANAAMRGDDVPADDVPHAAVNESDAPF